jgi:hypothetical protein
MQQNHAIHHVKTGEKSIIIQGKNSTDCDAKRRNVKKLQRNIKVLLALWLQLICMAMTEIEPSPLCTIKVIWKRFSAW